MIKEQAKGVVKTASLHILGIKETELDGTKTGRTIRGTKEVDRITAIAGRDSSTAGEAHGSATTGIAGTRIAGKMKAALDAVCDGK